MDAERWRRIEELYHAALERPAEGRATFLAGACAGDVELRREIDSLLAHEGSAVTFLDKPAIEIAASFPPVEKQAATSNSRPPWWMYVIAAAFLARAVFTTDFCLFGPESMGIDVRTTKTHPIVGNVLPNSPAERA